MEPRNFHFWQVFSSCCWCRNHILKISIVKHGVRPNERETSRALGQLREAFTVTGALGVSAEGCEGRPQLTPSYWGNDGAQELRCGDGAQELRCGESLHRACTGRGREAGGQAWDRRKAHWSHAKEFGLHPLDTGLFIRRVMLNCVLVVHSLKIKRY